MRLGSVCLVFLAVPLGLSVPLAGSARGEAPAAVLVLPTQLGGNVPDRAAWQRAFDERVEGAVRRSGRTPRPSGPLTTTESSCRDATCLARLAEAASVDLVILGRVVADRGSPPSYKLSLLRFDRERPGSVRQEEAECSVCTAPEAAERLERMVTQSLPALVVQPRRAIAVEPAPAGVPAAPATPTVVATSARTALSRGALYGLIGGTAAVGVAGVVLLGVGGRALALDGDPASAILSPATQAAQVYDTRGPGIGLVASGTVFVLGAAVGLGFELLALRRSAR